MTMNDLHQKLVSDAVHAVVGQALELTDAPDLDAARKTLNAVWFAVHKAQEAINNAERETRQAALAKLGEPA